MSCAVAVQGSVNERNSILSPEKQFQLRVGVHVGDVFNAGGDILGDAVNIASRIEPLAEPGRVCISGQVYDQVRNKAPLRFIELESRNMKNLSVQLDVYKLEPLL